MPSDPFAALLGSPPDLPVRHGLGELREAVAAHGTAVLQSPPGSGKTTLVPPALAAGTPGRVVVTQPRRIAARAAARRLAQLLGEPVGGSVGFAVRGERRSGPRTRVEVVTAGILLRRLQRDPELPGVAAVVLDEVHERQLESDLLLAMLVDVRATLREDLHVVAMSATVEAERVANVLGAGTPVVIVPGALHPVETIWCPPPATAPRLSSRGTTPTFLDHVAATARRALEERDGDVLVFLPGAREVDDIVRRLRAGGGAATGGGSADVDVMALHGRLPSREQDRALNPGERRRVVVATAVAESSLTVPGVRIVVDAGLARAPQTDHQRGLAGLVTRSVSQAGAEQRAGRAGREGPGAVYRCWTQAEHARMERHPAPEILTADLTATMLELARWGSPQGEGMALLDPPPPTAAGAAHEILLALGAVDPDGSITPRGRDIAGIALDPRLARALLDGARLVGASRAADVVSMLGEDLTAPGGDLPALLRQLRRGDPLRGGGPAWQRQRRRLLDDLGKRSGGEESQLGMDLAVGLVTALAHPTRVARLRPGGSTYLMAGGAGARLAAGSPLTGSSWLAVADASRSPGQVDATIRSAAPIDESTAVEAAAGLLREEDVVQWRGGRIHARRVTALGAIELTSDRITRPASELVARAVQQGLAEEGLDLVPWPAAAVGLRQRLAFLHHAIGEPWPDVSDEALLSGLAQWLGPDLDRVRTAGDLRRLDTTSALRRLLPWPAAAELDRLAPPRITVPSGSSLAIDYSDPARPVLPVRLQEVFGWRDTPRLAGSRVPLVLELLSPARRPAAVTADLASFWQTGYPQVRAELRGRYAKHPWPEDPATAPATTRTKRAEERSRNR